MLWGGQRQLVGECSRPNPVVAFQPNAEPPNQIVQCNLPILGLVQKPVLVVPDHMLEQVTREWLQLYPQAKLLAASSDDLPRERRRAFVARAATNDWDAIVFTRGAFLALPVTNQTMATYMDSELTLIREQVQASRERAGSNADERSIKKLEKEVMRREETMKGLLDKPSDPGLSFEATGIDYLIIDELHDFKNLNVVSNIPGAAITGSKRATDLYMKVEYLRGRHGERVMTGATATPIANSITEMYVMQRYLDPEGMSSARPLFRRILGLASRRGRAP